MEIFISSLRQTILPGGTAPEVIQIFRGGENRVDDGASFWFTEESAKLIINRFNDLNHDVVIDYEHQTMKDVEAPAAGWITALEWRGPGEDEGLWAQVRWTEKGAAYVSAKEYRYYSPVFLTRKSDKVVVAFLNLALTNQPGLKDVAALAAKMDVAALAAEHIHLNQGDEEMTLSEEAAKALGLDVKAKDEDILTALKGLATSNEQAQAELKVLKDAPGGDDTLLPVALKALGLGEDATAEDVETKIAALKASDTTVGELGQQVNTLKSEIASMKGESLIQVALKDGKITQDDADKWGRKLASDNPDQFKAIVLSRKPGCEVPLDKLELKTDPKGNGSGVDDETQLSINKQLGISDETFKKYAPGAEGGE